MLPQPGAVPAPGGRGEPLVQQSVDPRNPERPVAGPAPGAGLSEDLPKGTGEQGTESSETSTATQLLVAGWLKTHAASVTLFPEIVLM